MKVYQTFSAIKAYKYEVLFVFIFIGFSLSYFDSYLDKGPLSMHYWRQTDCLSITKNYSDGALFLQPEIHYLGADEYTSGKSAGEFPILYYIVGKIWSIIGESFVSYRIFYLLILFTGSFALFKSTQQLFNNSLLGIFVALLLFTSPTYAFYGISFLTDIPAFSFVLIALYLLLRYHQKGNVSWLYSSLFFFMLAGLIKISSLIAFVFFGFILVLELLRVNTLGDRRLFKAKYYEVVGFFLVFAVILSWYFYASYYNGLHGFKYTINDVYLPGKMTAQEFAELKNGIKNLTGRLFFSRPVIFGLMFMAIMNLFLFKKIPLLGYLSNVVILIGSSIYFFLWLPILKNHDYYFSALLILYPGILFPFIYYFKTRIPKVRSGNILGVFLGVFLAFNFLYCLSIMKVKLSQEHRFMKYHHQSFMQELTKANFLITYVGRFEELKPYLKEIGIRKEDKVISLPDFTPNASLFLSGQKGWTNFSNLSTDDIDFFIQKGAKYLIISDPQMLSQDYLQPFLNEHIGSQNGIEIFKLQKRN